MTLVCGRNVLEHAELDAQRDLFFVDKFFPITSRPPSRGENAGVVQHQKPVKGVKLKSVPIGKFRLNGQA